MICARLGQRLGAMTMAVTFATAGLAAPSQTTLFNFSGGASPAYPNGRLLTGANGVLYGVSRSGGAANAGTVFMLNPPSSGNTQWSVNVIYSFQNGADGANPAGGLISDANGVLYGVAGSGGAGINGTVFSLTPPAGGSGAWTETTLHAFTGGTDGDFPSEDAGLVMDAAGALYGTTINGGAGNGTAFKLSPPAMGSSKWTETILHAFKGGDDGYFPAGGLLAGAGGVLYGTTSGGGKSFTCSGGCGTVFSLTPPAGGKGKWTHAVLHAFSNSEGDEPEGSLISDATGDLYGVDLLGGGATACSLGCGTVFRLAAPAGGGQRWAEQTLHVFTSGADSEFPMSALVLASDGKLWGTAAGAQPNRLGATFNLAPPAGGKKPWKETIIHMFQGGDTDGATPSAGLTPGAGGVFYGVTSEGGSGGAGICGSGCGTMFQITP
jgi:hypothetical protein